MKPPADHHMAHLRNQMNHRRSHASHIDLEKPSTVNMYEDRAGHVPSVWLKTICISRAGSTAWVRLLGVKDLGIDDQGDDNGVARVLDLGS